MEQEKKIMDHKMITSKVIRMSHEIVEKNQVIEDIVMVGMYVILITEVIHRTALALLGALVMLIILFYTGVL